MEAGKDDAELRARALRRIKEKRDFAAHAIAYVAVNALLVLIWGAVAGGGFFWPMFPIIGWGIGLFFHGWDVYRGEPTEEEIGREMARIAGRGR